MTDFHGLETFVVLGQHQWCKDYSASSAVQAWLKAVHFRVTIDHLLIIGVDAKHDEVSVNGMGDVSYPKGAHVERRKYPLNKKLIDKMERLMDDMSELECDLSLEVDALE